MRRRTELVGDFTEFRPTSWIDKKAIANVLSLVVVEKSGCRLQYSTGNGFTVYMPDDRSVTFKQSEDGLHYVTIDEMKECGLESNSNRNNQSVVRKNPRHSIT